MTTKRSIEEENNLIKDLIRRNLEEIKGINLRLDNLEKSLLTAEMLKQTLIQQECQCKEEFKELKELISSKQPEKAKGITFTDWQYPPSLPYAKPFEPYKPDKGKEKQKPLTIKD